MKNKNIHILIVLIIIYFLLKHLIPFGNYVIYPINLLVTFMHEFWHAFFALLSWWSVHHIEINTDGSWLATTAGWMRSFILIWGYIWSALFGNLLLRIGLQDKWDISEKLLYSLAWLLILVSLVWFSWIVSTLIMIGLSAVIILLAKFTNYDKIILQFLWVASILFIIEDFNVWPSSDLSKFAEIFVIIPQSVWMIIWLIIVLAITFFNLKFLFKKK